MSLQGNSSFLNKNIINGFSLGVLLVLFLMLVWIVNDKHNVYIQNNKNVSRTAVENIRDALVIAIETKKRTLDNFTENNRPQIIKLIQHPENKSSFDYLYLKLKKQLPDLFTFNVYREGKGMVTEHNDFVGRICRVDLEDFLMVDFHEKRTHPSSVQYHFDEISSLQLNGERFLFFASFSLDSLVDVLEHATPEGHEILIVNDSDDGFIEITRKGVRNLQESMRNPTIQDFDSEDVLSKMSVPGTHWYVVDLQDNTAIKMNLYSYVVPSVLVYILVAMIVLFMRSILNRSFILLSGLNEQLLVRNKEITALNADLESLTITDALTGLYNRRYFDSQYENEWNRAFRDHKIISVMIVDIDYFKKYNDRYGHPEGDKCLKQVASILSSAFSRSNEFVARFGGEEFIAVINDNKKASEEIARQIHAALEVMKIEHDQSDEGRVTVSIGIASDVPDQNSRRSDAVKKADEALYQAKLKGRDQTVAYNL